VIVTAAVIVRDGKVLIAKRKEGKWEFPGGGLEDNETLEECLKRELMEEMGVDVERLEKFMCVEKGGIKLHVFIARYNGNIIKKEHEAIKWVDFEEIKNYEFMDADREVVEELRKRWNDVVDLKQRKGR
jgi:8-oxo-dGTP diphosphatase